MIFYSDNPHADFDNHETYMEQQLEKLPVCSKCGEHIQDDYYYEINGEILCEEHMNDLYRKDTDSFVDS